MQRAASSGKFVQQVPTIITNSVQCCALCQRKHNQKLRDNMAEVQTRNHKVEQTRSYFFCNNIMLHCSVKNHKKFNPGFLCLFAMLYHAQVFFQHTIFLFTFFPNFRKFVGGIISAGVVAAEGQINNSEIEQTGAWGPQSGN